MSKNKPAAVLSEAAAAIVAEAHAAYRDTLNQAGPEQREQIAAALEDAAKCTAAVAFATSDDSRAAALKEQAYALSTLASKTAEAAEVTRARWQQVAYVALHTATRAAVDALAVAVL